MKLAKNPNRQTIENTTAIITNNVLSILLIIRNTI